MSLLNKSIVDFKVQAFHGNEFRTVSREDVMGKWSLFFFYPADFSFVCPTELEELSSEYHKFQGVGCEIYAVSTDSHFVHKAWHDTSERVKRVQFPMLADTTGVLTRGFDVMNEETGRSERGAFIVDPSGRIVSYEVSAGNVGRSAGELFRKLLALRFVSENCGKACPASWHPGNDALTPSISLVGLL